MILPAEVLFNTLILDTVFSYLASDDILAMGRSCRTIRNAKRSYFRRALDANHRLVRFFPKPTTFRTLQHRLGITITTSKSFDKSYRSSVLNITVNRPHILELGEFLLAVGYTLRQSGEGGDSLESTYRRMCMPIDFGSKRLDGFSKPVFGILSFDRTRESEDVSVVATVVSISNSVNTTARVSLSVLAKALTNHSIGFVDTRLCTPGNMWQRKRRSFSSNVHIGIRV
jgi:hypothetical protein